jgi:hypothetical protein
VLGCLQAFLDPAATILAAELLLQGPDDLWPFPRDKQAQLVSALASALPSVKPGAISVTAAAAPFRRRRLLQGVGQQVRHVMDWHTMTLPVHLCPVLSRGGDGL